METKFHIVSLDYLKNVSPINKCKFRASPIVTRANENNWFDYIYLEVFASLLLSCFSYITITFLYEFLDIIQVFGEFWISLES